MFENIIMRQDEGGRWVFHRRLDATNSEQEVRDIAIKVARRYGARVTVLGADEYQVTAVFHVTSSGIGSIPRA